MNSEERLDFTPLAFGKHKGKTPEQVAEVDAQYVVWMYETIQPRPCSKALYDACLEDLAADNDGVDQNDFF